MALTLTGAVLRELFPRALDGYLNAIEQGGRLFDQYGVNTPLRVAHFLAQGAAETDGFEIAEESGNYSAARLLEVFPHHFTPAQAAAYARKPAMILSRAYANRLGNGGELSRDGWTYRGRGMVQLTGRENYKRRSSEAGLDLVADPDKAAEPSIALKIMLAEWLGLCLNDWADRGAKAEVVLACSRGINCGSPTSGITPNGLRERGKWFVKIWAKLGDGSAVAASQEPIPAPDPYVHHTAGKAMPVDPTPVGLVNLGCPQAADLRLGKQLVTAAGAATAVGGAVSNADTGTLTNWATAVTDAREVAQPVVETVQWAAHSLWIAGGLALVLLYLIFHRAQQRHVEAIKEGGAL